MMTNIIVGRENEIKILEEILHSKKPEFVAVYGRRRVGKTYLINNFMKSKNVIFLRVTGIKDAAFKKQIRHVTDEIGNIFYEGARLEARKNWIETFSLLTEAIQKVKEKNEPIVLFFDEFPWMATKRSLLLQALDHYWNHLWSNDVRIKLIICGSASSWIIDKIINNKGGLHNRITRNVRIEPLNLKETKDYLNNLGVRLNSEHVTQLYMVTGGIPYYLSHVKPGLSAKQIIGSLAFNKDSLLLREFKNLYSSLFEDVEGYIDLIRIIAQKRYGVSQAEIIKKSRYFSKGGRISKRLIELEECGFIIGFMPYQHKRQGLYYRLIDEYTLFYFNWVEPINNKLKKADLGTSYWETLQATPAWNAWAGYAFEAICYKHLSQIRKALNISVDAITDCWRYTPRKESNEEGTQIDLLFDRSDNCVTLCEIKYTNKIFVINKDIAFAIEKKGEIFKERTRTKKQLFWAVVSANGIKKTTYSEKLINGIVTLEDLFTI